MTPEVLEEAILNPDYLIKIAKALKEEKEKNKVLEIQNSSLTANNLLMQPKAEYYDTVLNSEGLFPISVIAKDYGKSAQWLNNYLYKSGVQFKQGKVWLLYQPYADKGSTKTKTFTYQSDNAEIKTYINTYWTQKGRWFIHNLLKENGISPIVSHSVE